MTPIRRTAHVTFHSLLHARGFRRFFIGQAVSVTGTWVQMVASAWLVLELTHSGVALGILAALTFLPILLFGAWAGTIADRFDRRRLLLLTQGLFAALAFALGFLTVLGVVQLWMVFALALAQGFVNALDNPTRQSFYADMVRPKDLPNAVSLNSALVTGTRIVGPAIAGILIATVGLGACFLLNGLSYLAVLASLHMIRREIGVRPVADRDTSGGVREGLRYVRRSPGLYRPLILMAVLFTFSFNFTVILPLLAHRSFGGGAGTFGLMMSIFGIGSLIGSLVLAHKSRPGLRFLSLAAIGLGACTVALSATPSLSVAAFVLIPLGFAGIAFMITGNSALQLAANPAMRGRVMALFSVVFLGSTPIGAPIMGWLAQQLGPRASLAAGGAVALGAGAVALWIAGRSRERSVPVGEVVDDPAAEPGDATGPERLTA